ncbi:hypothetical protein DFP73DRAFT_569646 [Morchella snyderi]|nr:hypothetical protein DFP73DRAFT_569646 [Morchella snyderi]
MLSAGFISRYFFLWCCGNRISTVTVHASEKGCLYAVSTTVSSQVQSCHSLLAWHTANPLTHEPGPLLFSQSPLSEGDPFSLLPSVLQRRQQRGKEQEERVCKWSLDHPSTLLLTFASIIINITAIVIESIYCMFWLRVGCVPTALLVMVGSHII